MFCRMGDIKLTVGDGDGGASVREEGSLWLLFMRVIGVKPQF